MVWRYDELPTFEQKNSGRPINAIAGWKCWCATGSGPPFTTWEVLSSKTHSFTDIPLDRFLAFRLFWATPTSNPNKVYSDIFEGWDWYAFRFQGQKIHYWRADNEADLDQHRHNASRKIAGALVTDPVWDAVYADLYDPAHAFGWLT